MMRNTMNSGGQLEQGEQGRGRGGGELGVVQVMEDWEAVEDVQGRQRQERQGGGDEEAEENGQQQEEEGAASGLRQQHHLRQQQQELEEEEYEQLEEQYELCPRDSSRMELTQEEITWAKAIKEAIESSNDIDNLNDFLYVQYALIDRDNIQNALERAQHFQIFREEYNIRDSGPLEGRQICQRFVELLPQIMLSMSFNKEEGNYVLVMDIAAFREKLLRTEADYNTLMGFVYNVGHFLSPDFKAIRQGTCFVIECDGYDWKNLTMRTRRRLWTESLAIYPYKIQQIKYFHTGTYANLAAALMKRFLPTHVYSKLQVGCQFAGRLDTFYAVPTREIANQRFLQRINTCLERRYENIANFTLP